MLGNLIGYQMMGIRVITNDLPCTSVDPGIGTTAPAS